MLYEWYWWLNRGMEPFLCPNILSRGAFLGVCRNRAGESLMSFPSPENLANFDLTLDSCQHSENEHEDKILPSQMIEDAMKDTQCDFGQNEGTVFTFVHPFWAFLSEMFHTGTEPPKTQAAVTRVNQLLIASEQEGCVLNNGRYCMVCLWIREDISKNLHKISLTRPIKEGSRQRVSEKPFYPSISILCTKYKWLKQQK